MYIPNCEKNNYFINYVQFYFPCFVCSFFFFFSYMLSKFWSKSRADFLIFSRLARCSPWEYLNVPNTVLCFETLLTPERTDYHSLKTISFLLEIHWLIITYSPMAEEASRDWRLLTTGCWTLFFFFSKIFSLVVGLILVVKNTGM